MKIFVTGATGFIGGHLAQRLATAGHQACCLVRDGARGRKLEEMGLTVVPGDVTDRASLTRGMEGCDRVFHLANIYTFWVPDRRDYHRVNVEGTGNVMQCAMEAGVSKVVHVSTYAIWARSGQRPFNEDTPVPSEQVSEYARTKYQGDLIAWEYHRNQGLPLVLIHPGNVLGRGDRKPTGQFMGDIARGKQPVNVFKNSVLTFVHVQDVAEAIIRAAEKPDNIGQRYIVAHQQLPWGELAAMAAEASGARLPRVTLPGPLALAGGAALTLLAGLTGRPPLWGLSLDAARSLASPLVADGSKAQRELGITYTPVRQAVEETVSALR